MSGPRMGERAYGAHYASPCYNVRGLQDVADVVVNERDFSIVICPDVRHIAQDRVGQHGKVSLRLQCVWKYSVLVGDRRRFGGVLRPVHLGILSRRIPWFVRPAKADKKAHRPAVFVAFDEFDCLATNIAVQEVLDRKRTWPYAAGFRPSALAVVLDVPFQQTLCSPLFSHVGNHPTRYLGSGDFMNVFEATGMHVRLAAAHIESHLMLIKVGLADLRRAVAGALQQLKERLVRCREFALVCPHAMVMGVQTAGK